MTYFCVVCQKRANFNLEGVKPPTHCAVHKLDGMVDVMNRRCRHCPTEKTVEVVELFYDRNLEDDDD